MKAVVVKNTGAPDVMEIGHAPEPVPGARQVVVSLHAAGVNPVDTYIRAGVEGYSPRLPFTPGYDGAGIVESVGKGVSRIAVGDRVYVAGTVTGTYAEQTLAMDNQVYPLPEGVSFEQGAGVGVPYTTAHRALFGRGSARPGEVVLVHGGSGGVGVAAIQLARAAGLKVLATAGTDAGMDMMRALGADHVFNHNSPDYLQHVFGNSGEHGVDIVLEMLANVNLGRDLTVLARGGRVVVIGSRGSVKINPRDAMSRDAAIFGMSLMNLSDADHAAIHAALVAGLQNGSLSPVVSDTYALDAAADAHRAVMGSHHRGKIILKCRNS